MCDDGLLYIQQRQATFSDFEIIANIHRVKYFLFDWQWDNSILSLSYIDLWWPMIADWWLMIDADVYDYVDTDAEQMSRWTDAESALLILIMSRWAEEQISRCLLWAAEQKSSWAEEQMNRWADEQMILCWCCDPRQKHQVSYTRRSVP